MYIRSTTLLIYIRTTKLRERERERVCVILYKLYFVIFKGNIRDTFVIDARIITRTKRQFIP